jgi:heme-degrading monooxygenase HmoA
MNLKANSHAQFAQAIERGVLPLLRKQPGFQDEIVFTSGPTKAIAISLWDRKESAEAYDRAGYPQVLKALTAVVEGTPHVEMYEVSNSTWHKLAANAPV